MQNFTGIEYLKIDVASNFGLSKANWLDRISWFDQNEKQLMLLMRDAKEPALFYAGTQAYRETLQGRPSGYPISLDATASGLQLLACLSGCEASARLCNVVPTGDCEAAYKHVYQAICKRLGTSGSIAYDDVKKAIMTSLYSSTAQPKRVFGEGEQLQVFYETMETMAPGAWELNKALQTLWQPYALSHDWVLPDNFHAHVKVQSHIQRFVQFQNAPVAVNLKVNQGTKEGRSISPNIVHSIDGMVVREMHRRCDYDPDTIREVRKLTSLANQGKLGFGAGGTRTTTDNDRMVVKLWEHYQDSGFLSTRILDYLDIGNFGHVDHWVIQDLLDSLPEKPFHVISVHDCFRCLPNYGNDLRRTYNKIFSEIAASDMLAFIASQILGKPIAVNKYGNISKKILNADYTLC